MAWGQSCPYPWGSREIQQEHGCTQSIRTRASMEEAQPGGKVPGEGAVDMRLPEDDELPPNESRKHPLTEWMQGVDDEGTRHAKRVRYG